MHEIKGYCPICDSKTRFIVKGPWFRDQLICPKCKSIPRERALAFVLSSLVPDWRNLVIHESSPADRGISAKLKRECNHYLGSQFFPEINETMVGDFHNVNLEKQGFMDEVFDVFISLDVMEHVFDPMKAILEIHRTLKPGGYAVMTFPIQKNQTDPLQFRANKSGNKINHLKEPEYHGNPIDENGSLVTVDYGYDIHQELTLWSNFNVQVIRFSRPDIGVIGEFTEVIVCEK